MYINRKYTGCNLTGCRPPKAKIIYNTGLATKKRQADQSLKQNWPIRHEMVMTGGTATKGKRVNKPLLLHNKYWSSCTVAKR